MKGVHHIGIRKFAYGSKAEFIRRVAIIPGGDAARDCIGNGRVNAILMVGGGALVLVVHRDLKLAERTVEMIQEFGGTASE